MEASEPVALSSPPINPVPGPPSARLVESSSAAVQNIARAMPKAFNRAGTGAAVKGVEAAKAGEAARSRGAGCPPDGNSKAKSAVKGLAPATTAIRPEQGSKAEPKKAAAAAGMVAAMLQGDQKQQGAQGCGGKKTFMVIAPYLVQFLPPKNIAPERNCIHCNQLAIPMHVIGWYPDIHHGSPLHLQVKVPAAAEELALRGGTCSLELGETRTSLAPVDEDPLVMGGEAHDCVPMKMVLALEGTIAVYTNSRSSFLGPRQALDHFTGWRIVCMEKVSLCLDMVWNRLE